MKKWLFRKKKILSIVSIALAAVTVIGLLTTFTTNAEDIDEKNPTDFTLKHINSDLENTLNQLPVYVGDGTFQESGGKYTMTSNTYCVWMGTDDVSFAYRQYNVKPTGSDYLEISTRIESFDAISGSQHANASVGLMVRSGLKADDSEVFLHCRQDQIVLVYRAKDGDGTGVKYTYIDAVYPVDIKMTIKKNQVTYSYQNRNMSSMVTASSPVAFKFDGPIYAGFAAHSVNEKSYVQGVMNGYTAKGIGTYIPTGDEDSGAGENDTETIIPVAPDEEMTGEDILMRETFTDGSMTDKKMAVGEYEWTGSEYRTLTVENNTLPTAQKNRVWFKDLTQDSADFAGDEHWTDYSVSAMFKFTGNCDPDPANASNTVKLIARHTQNDFYGHSSYAAVIRNENRAGVTKRVLSLYKQWNDEATGDGTRLAEYILNDSVGDKFYTEEELNMWHTVKMVVFDNQFEIYWDDKLVIEYTDNGDTPTANNILDEIMGCGNVGIMTEDTSVMIDNIVVCKLEDKIGGDYDNLIGTNWNDEIPPYLIEWIEAEYPFILEKKDLEK